MSGNYVTRFMIHLRLNQRGSFFGAEGLTLNLFLDCEVAPQTRESSVFHFPADEGGALQAIVGVKRLGNNLRALLRKN